VVLTPNQQLEARINVHHRHGQHPLNANRLPCENTVNVVTTHECTTLTHSSAQQREAQRTGGEATLVSASTSCLLCPHVSLLHVLCLLLSQSPCSMHACTQARIMLTSQHSPASTPGPHGPSPACVTACSQHSLPMGHQIIVGIGASPMLSRCLECPGPGSCLVRQSATMSAVGTYDTVTPLTMTRWRAK
jgi:hypothetical protein